MARCQLTGQIVQFGHKVSHSNRKSSRRFAPNIQSVTLASAALRRRFSLRISTRALRSVQRHGSLDAFLLATNGARLSPDALRLKARVRKALSAPLPR